MAVPPSTEILMTPATGGQIALPDARRLAWRSTWWMWATDQSCCSPDIKHRRDYGCCCCWRQALDSGLLYAGRLFTGIQSIHSLHSRSFLPSPCSSCFIFEQQMTA